MGSSKRRKPKGQPDHPLESGVDQAGDGSGISLEEVNEDEGLVVSLVQIKEDVLTRTSPGDVVRIADESGKLQVHTRNGHLGNIPPTSAGQVRQRGLKRGIVQHVSASPLQVRVHLTG